MTKVVMLALACLTVAATVSAADDFPVGTSLAVERAHKRPDGSYSLRLADGSSAYAWKTAYGYSVSFPGTRRGQLWTRTKDGWRVTDLETTTGLNEARWEAAQPDQKRTEEARRQGGPRRVRRIGEKP